MTVLRKAWCRIGRALDYWWLINGWEPEYCRHYNDERYYRQHPECRPRRYYEWRCHDWDNPQGKC